MKSSGGDWGRPRKGPSTWTLAKCLFFGEWPLHPILKTAGKAQ